MKKSRFLCFALLLASLSGPAMANEQADAQGQDSSAPLYEAAKDAVLLDGLLACSLALFPHSEDSPSLPKAVLWAFVGYGSRNLCSQAYADGESSLLCSSLGGILGYGGSHWFEEGTSGLFTSLAAGLWNYNAYEALGLAIDDDYENTNPLALLLGLTLIEGVDAAIFKEPRPLFLGVHSALVLYLSLAHL